MATLPRILLFAVFSIFILKSNAGRWSSEKPDDCPSEDPDTHVCKILKTITCEGRRFLSSAESHHNDDNQDNHEEDGDVDNDHENDSNDSSKDSSEEHDEWGEHDGQTGSRRRKRSWWGNNSYCKECPDGETCKVYSCYEECCEGYERRRQWMYECSKNESIECENGGTPRRAWLSGWKCMCPQGYRGEHCEIPCEVLKCENGGTPRNLYDGWTCICPRNYGGVHCETQMNQNSTMWCENGGTPIPNWNNTRMLTWECSCLIGYTGERCENVMQNHTIRCENGGTAVPNMTITRGLTWMCNCPLGYMGYRCEAVGASCQNDGQTYQHGESFMDRCNSCFCSNGAVGCTKMACVGDCMYAGHIYTHGSSFMSIDGCNDCHCYFGRISCTEKACMSDRTLTGSQSLANCLYDGHKYVHGSSFPAADGCNTCSCDDGFATCTEMGCPQVPDVGLQTGDTPDDDHSKKIYLPIVGVVVAVIVVGIVLLLLFCRLRNRKPRIPTAPNVPVAVAKTPHSQHDNRRKGEKMMKQTPSMISQSKARIPTITDDAPSVFSNATYASVDGVRLDLPPYDELPPNPPAYSDNGETCSQYSFHLPPEYSDSTGMAELRAPPVAISNAGYASIGSVSDSSTSSGSPRVHRSHRT